jgi:hypothetical protein
MQSSGFVPCTGAFRWRTFAMLGGGARNGEFPVNADARTDVSDGDARGHRPASRVVTAFADIDRWRSGEKDGFERDAAF